MFDSYSAIRSYSEYLQKLSGLSDVDEYLEYQEHNQIRIYTEGKYSVYICADSKEHIPGYYHAAIFDLSYPITYWIYHYTGYHLYICCDVSYPVTDVTVSLLAEEDSLYFRNTPYGDDNVIEDFTKEYTEYLDLIDTWVNTGGIELADTSYVKYKTVPRDVLVDARFDLSYFTDDSIEIQRALDQYDIDRLTALKDVAEVILHDDPFTELSYSVDWEQKKFKGNGKEAIEDSFYSLCFNLYEKCKEKSQGIAEKDLFILKLQLLAYDFCVYGARTDIPFAHAKYNINFITTRNSAYSDVVLPIKEFFDLLCAEPYVPGEAEKRLDSDRGITIRLINVGAGEDNEPEPFNQEILKNDIVFRDETLDCRLISESDLPARAENHEVIIRPTKIDPYFLYKYFKSNLFRRILLNKKIGKPNDGFENTKERLSELPVIIPSEDTSRLCRDLCSFDELSADSINMYIAPVKGEDNSLQSQFREELFNKYLMDKRREVSSLIKADLGELKTCLSSKVYKATLILAGSIMETILLEWLSERDGKNYFKDGLTICKNGEERNATLIDYIKLIAELEYPDWMEREWKAHYIRKKRNLVHARLCMDPRNEINEDTCKKVLSYLNEIIESYLKSKAI